MRCFCLSVVAGAVTLSTQALAGPPPCDHAIADPLWRQGVALKKQGDLVNALDRLTTALRYCRVAAILAQIGDVHEEQGRLAAAHDDYTTALRLNDDTRNPMKKQILDAALREAIARMEPRIGRLEIIVTPQPPDLRVTVDETEQAQVMLGQDIVVDAGDHAVEASALGYITEHRSTNVQAHARQVVRIELKEEPAPAAPAPQRPPPPVMGLPHEAPRGTTPEVQPSPSHVASTAVLVAAGALGTAAIALGLHTMVVFGNAIDDCSGKPEICGARAKSRYDGEASATTIVWIATGAAAATGLVLRFGVERGPGAAEVAVSPAPLGANVAVRY